MHPVLEDRRYLIPFRATLLSQIFTDVLVIGGGVGGLRAAIAASEHSDVIVTFKDELKRSNTYWAQGGIAVTLDASDSVDAHVNDTLIAGADLCDEPMVRSVIEHGPARIRELVNWNMRLDRVTGGTATGGAAALATGGGRFAVRHGRRAQSRPHRARRRRRHR